VAVLVETWIHLITPEENLLWQTLVQAVVVHHQLIVVTNVDLVDLVLSSLHTPAHK
jgi:hypothetical protein